MDEKFIQMKDKVLETLDGNCYKVFSILLRHSNSNFECYPSVREMARKYKLSKNTITSCTNKLEEMGIITKSLRQTKDGKKTSNFYTINRDYVVENEKKKKRIISLPDWFNKNLERKELDINKKEEIERMLKEFN